MDEAPSRAERRAQSRRHTRLFLSVGGGVLAVAVIAVVVALVAGDDDDGTADKTAGVPIANTNVSLELGEVSAESAGPPAQVTPEQVTAIMKVVGDYVSTATVDPLRSAEPAGDLSALFDAGALERVTGIDRAVMLDEGLPKVTGELDVVAQPVAIVGLADQSGTIVLATAAVALDVKGATRAKGGPLHIFRRGDLVLAPDASGVWKVTAFDIAVARSGAGLDAGTAGTATTEQGSR